MALNFFQAQQLALKEVKRTLNIETIPINEALNRVLAKDIYATRDLPPFDNSAMDGYGFKYRDRDKSLKVVERVLAGDSKHYIIGDGKACKIMTGAEIPEGVDTVIPKERCKIINDTLYIDGDIKLGDSVRKKGEEIQKEELLLSEGRVLNYPDIALLASQGISEVEVYKRLKIAIIASGSELKEPWESASDREIYNINSINIEMALKRYGFEAQYLGRISDNLEEIQERFSNLREFNLVIITGGVSVGDADLTKRALLLNGFEETFHGIKVKPGHPTMFGKIGDTYIIALAGNPLAAILNLLILFIPVVFKMQGAKNFDFKRCKAKLRRELRVKPSRTNLVLGKVENGYFSPYKDNKYGSGMIMPLVESNAIAIFEEGISSLDSWG